MGEHKKKDKKKHKSKESKESKKRKRALSSSDSDSVDAGPAPLPAVARAVPASAEAAAAAAPALKRARKAAGGAFDSEAGRAYVRGAGGGPERLVAAPSRAEWFADQPKQWFFNACQNHKLPQPKLRSHPANGGFECEMQVPVGMSSSQWPSVRAEASASYSS